MDGVGGLPNSHHFRHVLTNVTLGLLQDSGWCASLCIPILNHTCIRNSLAVFHSPSAMYHVVEAAAAGPGDKPWQITMTSTA